MYYQEKINLANRRFWLGVFLVVFGCALSVTGLVMKPVGEIHGSVLTAIGECFGLAGCCIGVFSYQKANGVKIEKIYDYIKEKEEDNGEEDIGKDGTAGLERRT